MSPTLKRALQFLISLAVGAACLVFAFRGVSAGANDAHITLDDLWARIRAVPMRGYVLFGALFLGQILIRIERWRWQVRGLTGHKPSFLEAWHINAVTFAAVFFLPLRLGEFVRPNLCARHGIMSASAGLAATALERIIDGLVTAALFGGLLATAPFPLEPWVRAAGVSTMLFFAGAVVFLIIAYRVRGPTTALVTRVGNRVSPALTERVLGVMNGFLDGLRCFQRPRDLLVYLALSVGFWGVNGLGTWGLLNAVDDATTVLAAYFCLCFLVIAVMLPAPPGNVGNFHAFATLGLTIAGVPKLSAITGAVLVHAVSSAALVVLALPSLLILGARHELSGASEPPAPTPPTA